MNNQKNKMNHQPGFLAASWDAWQAAYLTEQGIADVVIEKAPEPPQLHPKSGKFQQVWSEVKWPVCIDLW